MGKKQELSPSEQLTNFLNFIDASERAYQTAWDVFLIYALTNTTAGSVA